MPATRDPLNLLETLIGKAKAAGADAADALYVERASMDVTWHGKAPDRVEREEVQDLGLRFMIGKRQAFVSGTDLSPDTLDELVERAAAMARIVPEDPFAGLADPDQVAHDFPDIDSFDPDEPDVTVLTDRARAAEDAARAVDGVTQVSEAGASWSASTVHLVASNGFSGSYQRSGHSLFAVALAGEGTGMETDYEWTSKVYAADMDSPETVGRKAGERAVARLNPQRVKTAKVPVVYDRRVAGRLIGALLGAINGAAIANGTSFLKDRMDDQVFGDGINIWDDPHRRRGPRSRPFDGEGIATRKAALIENGVLKTWLLDLRSARKLGLRTTGHASRGTGGPPGPSASNVYLEPGDLSPEELMADIEGGLFVTDLMGQGVNGVTGDYSLGASGFWIEKGKLSHAVSELTIAGNLKDIYPTIRPANDLEFKSGVDAPTLRIEGMTVAGN